MKAASLLMFVVFANGPCVFADDMASQPDHCALPKRNLTLLADPTSVSPSPTEISTVRTRVLRAEYDAAAARIAAIEARIHQIRDESESQIKSLSDERDALLRRENRISELVKSARQ